jgi:hypothetical protein
MTELSPSISGATLVEELTPSVTDEKPADDAVNTVVGVVEYVWPKAKPPTRRGTDAVAIARTARDRTLR